MPLTDAAVRNAKATTRRYGSRTSAACLWKSAPRAGSGGDSATGPKPIRNISAPELLAAVRRIERRGTVESARRILQMRGYIFRYAIATGQAGRDIAADLRGSLPPARAKHHASLTDPRAVAQHLRAPDGSEGADLLREFSQVRLRSKAALACPLSRNRRRNGFRVRTSTTAEMNRATCSWGSQSSREGAAEG